MGSEVLSLSLQKGSDEAQTRGHRKGLEIAWAAPWVYGGGDEKLTKWGNRNLRPLTPTNMVHY